MRASFSLAVWETVALAHQAVYVEGESQPQEG
jgi:hypothetical protein